MENRHDCASTLHRLREIVIKEGRTGRYFTRLNAIRYRHLCGSCDVIVRFIDLASET